jgi:hypothetical protein
MPTVITGSPQSVSLGGGYALRAPGLRGSAELLQPASLSVRGGRGSVAELQSLEEALRASNVTVTRDIALDLQPALGASGGALRSAHGEAAIELEVPDAGPDHGQLVLSIDDAGALRWHLPEATARSAGGPASRGAGGGHKRFRIPATVVQPPPPGPGQARQRSVLGLVGRRLLKSLVYPLVDPVLGAVSEHFARRWEAVKRPHRLCRFTPSDYTRGEVPELSAGELAAMAAAGPVLLFVHGTFSTAHAAFGDLPAAAMSELHRRYGERVLAFDHPTLASDPAANVRWLLQQLPSQGLQLDIVSHSRGGLVSRLLAERPASFGLDGRVVNVRRLVMAGVPNAGTLLADPDHMVDMIDRLTTVLTLFPSGAAAETLEALVTVVKMIGRGILTGLDGLVSMHPKGAFLSTLNVEGGAAQAYFAVASNFEPKERGLRALVAGAADRLVDFVFADAGNDLVVPTDGVHQGNGHPVFPLPAERVLLLTPEDGAMHTSLFTQASVEKKLFEWLG